MERGTAGETRHAILEAAGQLFAERGLDGVGVREIVKQAGTSLSSVNYHFTSKENLYKECLKHVVGHGLRLTERFSVLDEPDLTTPQQVSDTLATLFRGVMMTMLGRGTPDWYGVLMVRSRMEMHHKSPRALFRVDEPGKLRQFVLKHCPGLTEAFVEHWFVSVMAQLQYYIMEKEAVLLGFGLEDYGDGFLEMTARFISEGSARTLGLPKPT